LNLYATLMCFDDIAIFGSDDKLEEEIVEYLE
jgi:hypothetical protein